MLPILHPGYFCLSRLLQQLRLVDIVQFLRLVWAEVVWSYGRSEDLQRPESCDFLPAFSTACARSLFVYCVLFGTVETILSWRGSVFDCLSCDMQSSCEPL